MFSFSVCNTSYFSSHRPDLAWLDYDYDTESLIEATRIPKIVSSEALDRPSDVHTFQNDGEVVVGTDASRHPLFDVLEYATSEWESLLDAHGGDVSAQTRVFRPIDSYSRPRSKRMLSCGIGHITLGRRVPIVSTRVKALRYYSHQVLFLATASTPSPVDLFTPISPSLLAVRQRQAEILPGLYHRIQ